MIKKLSSRLVYENKWMKVREDDVVFPDGTKGIYGVVEKPHFALIIPEEKEHFYLVRQYRYPVEAAYWEFPQGSYEEQLGVDPRELAAKELQEETGLMAKEIIKLGFLYEAYGFSNQGFYIFLARDFTSGDQELEHSEQGMEVGRFSCQEFEAMVQRGEITDAPTIAAYGLLRMQKAH